MCACGQPISLSKGLVTCKGVLKRWLEFERQSIQIKSQLLKFSDISQSTASNTRWFKYDRD